MTHGNGNHTQNQVEVPEEDAPDLDHVDEPPVSDFAVNEGAAPKAQADSELSTDRADPELSTGTADPEKAEAQRASTSGGAAAEVTAASDTNNHPPSQTFYPGGSWTTLQSSPPAETCDGGKCGGGSGRLTSTELCSAIQLAFNAVVS